jgi:hypothetical protein
VGLLRGACLFLFPVKENKFETVRWPRTIVQPICYGSRTVIRRHRIEVCCSRGTIARDQCLISWFVRIELS